MTFTFDEERVVAEVDCPGCGQQFTLVKCFVLKDGSPFAATFTACHHHDGQHEAWIDAIMGPFIDDDHGPNVTFGCRVGPVQKSPDPAATAVQAGEGFPDDPMWGRKLSREEALAHPLIRDFWDVVDFVLTSDPLVSAHVYRQPKRRRRWF